MKKQAGSPLGLAMCGLLLVACGGLELEDSGEAYSEALCHRQARCGEIRDEEACVSRGREFARDRRAMGLTGYESFAGSLRAGRVRFDEDAAEACVARIRDSSCNESLGEARDGDVCDLLVGQREDGEVCLATEECRPASYCEWGPVTAACYPGTCQPRPGVGELLTDGQECAPGLVPVENRCQPISDEGEPCQEDYQCAQGLRCFGSSGTCRRLSPEGGACVPGESACLPHLRCVEGSCLRLADVGEPCSPRSERSWCKTDLFCAPTEDPDTGICQQPAGLGEPCSFDTPCQNSLVCAGLYEVPNPTCQKPGRAGQACVDSRCGPGAWCNDRTENCLPQGWIGDPCENFLEYSCRPGLWCLDSFCRPAFGGTCGG